MFPTKSRMKVSRLLFCLLLALFIAAPGSLHAQSVEAQSTNATRQIVLSEEEAALFEVFAQVKAWIQEYSPREVNLEQLYEGAKAGMVEAVGDPYSQYLTREQYESFQTSLEGVYSGIGITMDLINGQITIVSTFSGSPAEKAGIKPGDVVLAVDGVDLRGKIPVDAQALIRGEVGAEVVLTIRRPSDGRTIELTVTRALISLDALEVEPLEGGVYYIRVPQFTDKAARDFGVVMDYLRSVKIEGLVLDLRNNPGGYVDSCLEIARHLVPKGTVVELRRKDLREPLYNPDDPGYIMPVAVLVNQGSASASEILAGAIRDRGVGILVGERTFGKASVQAVVPLGNGSGLRLTIADYVTPSGYNLASNGLLPDIEVTPSMASSPEPLDYTRPLVQGMVGLDVLSLQECLNFLGYDADRADGIFGKRTAAALSLFLADHGAEWNGSFEEEHAEALRAAITAHILNEPDAVLEVGIKALRAKIDTGNWPVSSADQIP